MIEIDKILEKLDHVERSQLGGFVQMLNDPLSRKILAKLASPDTPMCLNDLPLKQLEASDSVSVMSRLHKFEGMNLVESKMVKHPSGAYRTFDITAEGRSIVEKYMKKEAETSKTNAVVVHVNNCEICKECGIIYCKKLYKILENKK